VSWMPYRGTQPQAESERSQSPGKPSRGSVGRCHRTRTSTRSRPGLGGSVGSARLSTCQSYLPSYHAARLCLQVEKHFQALALVPTEFLRHISSPFAPDKD
jgi:hypothetical protein